MKALLRNMWQDEAGQDLIEYVLIGGLISIVCVLALTNLGNALSAAWTNLKTQVSTAN